MGQMYWLSSNFANMKGLVGFMFIFGPLVVFSQITDNGKFLPTPESNENSLFYLQRTKNTNTIMYELNRNSDGSLNEQQPVKVFWRHYELGDKVTNDLNFFERSSVYGVSVEKFENGFKVKLKAFKQRPFELVRDKAGEFIGQMSINGKEARLDRIYVESKEGMFLPTVLHVDLFGTDLETGESVIERVMPD